MQTQASSSKKAKLEQLLQFKSKLPAHSQSALQAFIEEGKEHGLPELSSSNDQRAARLAFLESCHGGHLGPLLQETNLQKEDGTSTTMFFSNFLVYLTTAYRQGGSFTQLIQAIHAAKPSSVSKPWKLILYADEIIPGNVLGRAERKLWAVYGTFDEFQGHLHHEDLWCTIALERSKFVATLDAGVAQMMTKVLESIFCNPMAEPRAGILLQHATGDIRLHFHWAIMLADGAAQKQIWSSKGDSGQKFCILCSNVRGMPAADQNSIPAGENVIQTTHNKYSQLVLCSDQELLSSYQRLDQRRGTCRTKAEFSKWQVACGLTWSKHALMLNHRLNEKGMVQPVSQFCHDYMHGILQGTGPVVLYQTFMEIERQGLAIWEAMETYLGYFIFPKQWSCSHLPSLMSKKRVEKYKQAQKFQSQASECLALYPCIRQFLQNVVLPAGTCPLACAAFLAQAGLMDQCHFGCMSKATSRTSLLQIAELAISSFQEAFPTVGLIKKWHWILHLPDLLQRHDHLPNCFTAERKHKTISAYATKLERTSSYEQHLLQQVLPRELMIL